MGLWNHLFLSSFIIYLLFILKCNCQQNNDDGSSYDDDNNGDNDNGDDDSDSDSDDDDDDDNSNNETCSFISGQGCLNGMCKYCAMCIPSNCILGTPYSTGNNDGSTCAALDDEDIGYDFYNYCLSNRDDDDDDDGCPTSTVCYQYQYSNTSHAWDKLTCDQSSCLLISEDGSPPPVPSMDTFSGNITVYGPNNSHPISSKSNHATSYPYYNELNIKSGSAASIALLTGCIMLALCLVTLLTRWCCRNKRLKRKVSNYFFFMNNNNNNNNSNNGSITTLSPPPSFHSNILFSTSPPQIMMLASHPPSEILPDYDQNIPPKYEHAIVTQIRGFASSTIRDETTEEENQPSSSSDNTVWIPVFVSPIPTLRPPNDTINRNRPQHAYHWVPSHQDWATIQHEQ